MVSMELRQKIGSFGLILGGSFITVFMLVIGGSDAIIYVVLGLLVAAAGVAMWRSWNRFTSYGLLSAGVIALVISVSRALTYGPTNDLVIVLFVLGVGLLFRGFQWFRAIRNARATSETV